MSNNSSRSFQRIYAVGDVHGRYDLFKRLVSLIARDQAAHPQAATQIVLLSNIIDCGPESARLVRGCMDMTAATDSFVVLKGNHEDMMVEALAGNPVVYSHWLHFGGRQTLLSWGIPPEVANGPATMDNLTIAANAIGPDVLRWLANLPFYHRHGDFLLVHAGIRPGIEIEKQDQDDLMWITDEFLKFDGSHGVTVIHGHSVSEGGPAVRANRIGIDTGAYHTNRLTALGIENGETWSIATMPSSHSPTDDITIESLSEDASNQSRAWDHQSTGGSRL